MFYTSALPKEEKDNEDGWMLLAGVASYVEHNTLPYATNDLVTISKYYIHCLVAGVLISFFYQILTYINKTIQFCFLFSTLRFIHVAYIYDYRAHLFHFSL